MKQYENINYSKIKLLPGFFKERYELNRKVTLQSVYKRFNESGRVDALKYNYNETKIYPHIFYDSDMAKWIESVAYLTINHKGEYLDEIKIIDELVDSLQKHQLEDGYLNSHFIQIEPENIFKKRGDHELYCAGHLIEAAIEYDRATGKHKLLDIMIKYLDCIENAFIKNKTAAFTTCGHEEIELALLKLYDYTNENRYLEMAKFFINSRGCCNEVTVVENFFTRKYDQSELPVRQLKEAEGHAVRAVYLYVAMSELALKTNDKELFDTCKTLFLDIINHKMYITGGIGSSRIGEAFTVNYDLPNLEAYSESCASIGLINFALSLQQFEKNYIYSDIIERIMCNSLLSSTSLNGKEFFYENPLEIHLNSVDKDVSVEEPHRTILPIRHRLEVFGCSCCPPNISRTFAKIANLSFSKNDDDFIINQLFATEYIDEKINIKLISEFPLNGKVKLEIKDNTFKTISIRIPSWSNNFKLNINNYLIKDHYLIFENIKDEIIEIDFDMKPYFLECNQLVRANNGRVCLNYGPTAYCIEFIDNPYPLNACSTSLDTNFEFVNNKDYPLYDIIIDGFVDNDFNSLYKIADSSKKSVKLRFKPYYTFANREECDMLVWVRK